MISNETTTTPETPQPAPPGALSAVLQRVVATPPARRAAPSPGPVLRWLTAPVLGLAIPESPFAARAAAPPPQPEPEAAAAEVLQVPPLVEPIVEPKRASAAQIMSEIAAIVVEAPEPVEPVVVDLSMLEAPHPPTPAAETPSSVIADLPVAAASGPPTPAPATPAPAPATVVPPTRSPLAVPARGVAVRRPRPRVGRPPPRRLTPPRPPRRPAPRPAAATQPAPSPHPVQPPAARAPARERPAPAATAAARTLRTAAVPETRPLAQNRRLYRRVRLSAELEIAGTPCRLVDLSIGGFAAAGTEKLDSGAVVPVTLRLTIDGINIGTEFSARMIYGNGTRAAGRFVDLTGAQTAFLRYIVTWRGEAVGAVGTTTLLDAITRWPERAFQPHPTTVKPPQPERPGFWSRLVGRIPLLGWRRRD